MKMKILAVRFFDWVILGALAILLILALVKSFLIHDKTLEEIVNDIKRSERTIKMRISSEEVRVPPPTDILGELRNRFEHMAVVSPLRRNPFISPVDVELGILQLSEGGSDTILVKGARVVEKLTESPVYDVKMLYDADEGNTTLEIAGLTKGDVLVRLRDDTGQTYRIQLNVINVPITPRPYPPVGVDFMVQPPMRTGTLQRRPPMVLMVFYPDNPPLDDEQHGQTTGAWIERKLADDPDVEYVRVNQKPLRKIIKREEALDMWQIFQPQTVAAPGAAAPAAGGGIVPAEAPDVITPVEAGGGMYNEPLIGVGSFAFIDATVDEGESYVYRIVTINEVKDREPAECEKPYVSPVPVNIPSLVRFSVKSVMMDGSAVFDITAPDAGGIEYTQPFTVRPGMFIGAPAKVRVSAADTGRAAGPGGGGLLGGGAAGPGPAGAGGGLANTTTKELDFSTGCILVGGIPDYKEIEYRTTFRNNKYYYQVRTTSGGQVLYLTPRGVLRWKGKGDAAVAPGPGGPGGMPGMGIMRRPGM